VRRLEVHAQDGRLLAPDDTMVDRSGIDGR
jgi:hypothetical protein